MSQDRPDEPERTRISGGEPPQDPQAPAQPQAPWSPVGDQQPAAPQQPQGGGQGWTPAGQQGGQPGGWGQQSGQQPGGWGQQGGQPGGWGQQGGQPGGGWGQQGGQAPYGGGPGGPGQGGPGWGGPGPGGPGGYGPPPGGGYPGGPGGPGGPRKPTDRKPLIIAGVALVVLLIVGGIGLVFVLGSDDEEPATVSDDSSETTEPTEEEPSEEEPTEEESAEEGSTGEEPDPDISTFEASDSLEAGEVCETRAMENAAEYDPADPRVSAYANFPETPEFSPEFQLQSAGFSESWSVEYNRHEDISVIACLVGEESGDSRTCEAEDADEETIEYEYVGVNFELSFYAAQTGAKLADGEPVEANAGSCPSFAFIFDDEESQYASPDTEDLDDAVNAFIDEAPEAP